MIFSHQILNHFTSLLIFILALSISCYSQATFKAGDKVFYRDSGKSDLFMAGGELTTESFIDGDAILAGGKIYIRDSIAQDLIIGGGQITVDASVGDDIRIFGGQIRINKAVKGDVIIFGGDVELNKDAHIGGDLILFTGNTSIYSNVNGNVKITGGEFKLDGIIEGSLDAKTEDLNINGTINGTSTIVSNNLYIGKRAQFKSDVSYWTKEGEADFGASTSEVSVNYNDALSKQNISVHEQKSKGKFAYVWFMLLKILAMSLVILVLSVFNPFLSKASLQIKEDFISSLGWGTLFFFAVPILSIFLLITIIGIPIGIVGLAITGIMLLISKAIASILVAHYLNYQYQKNWSHKRLFFVSVGIYILFILFNLIPIIGWLLSFILILVSLGSIVLEIRSRRIRSLS